MTRGLGTQLRHLIDLLDGAVSKAYADAGLEYRPRYTPIIKALLEREPITVGEIAHAAGITQPAATQTVGLMVKAGIVTSRTTPGDGRQRLIRMTRRGRELVPRLKVCWQAVEVAANSLETDMRFPLSEILECAIRALDKQSFGTRIREARLEMADRTERDVSTKKVRSQKKRRSK
jgi:MarR family transcriptional regulator, organic hydroperoxide resistance regulator